MFATINKFHPPFQLPVYSTSPNALHLDDGLVVHAVAKKTKKGAKGKAKVRALSFSKSTFAASTDAIRKTIACLIGDR